MAVFGLPDFGYSHISDPTIAGVLHDDILGFDVAVDYTLGMHIFESTDQTSQHKLSLWLRKPPPFPNMIPQITTRQQITNQVQILAVLEREVHIHEESNKIISGENSDLRVLELFKQTALIDD